MLFLNYRCSMWNMDKIKLSCIWILLCIFLYCRLIIVSFICWFGSSRWLQISVLTKKNKILAHKCKGSVKDGTKLYKNATGKDVGLQFTKLTEEIAPSSPSQNEVRVFCNCLQSRVHVLKWTYNLSLHSTVLSYFYPSTYKSYQDDTELITLIFKVEYMSLSLLFLLLQSVISIMGYGCCNKINCCTRSDCLWQNLG
jgi:hypothetical protein